MKISGKFLAVCMLLACGCLWSAGNVSAKVCFVGDSDCAGGADFGEYVDPAADGDLCKQEGYTSKDVCQADMTKHIVGYCPYNANYVMCCGREYAYDACVYPLVNDGKCGNRYKCACDSKKFKFKQQSASICKNVINGTQYKNSIASGASCVYTGFSGGQSTVVSQFTECLCDRGLYPKTTEECSSIGSAAAGNSCTDSNGNVYYSTCLCGDDYKVISSECKYGTDARQKLCQQGDVYKARECCDCNNGTYPYDNIDDVDSANSPVATYASCEKEKFCTRGSRYRATSCKLGYKVVNGKCEPKECGELLIDYASNKGISGSYAIYTGKEVSAKNVIVGSDIGGYKSGVKWSHFNNKKVISGAAYIQTITGSDSLTKLAKQQCTETPFIEFDRSEYDDKPNGVYDFSSVGLKTEYETITGNLTCTNCSIESSSSWTIDSNANVLLTNNYNLPNYGNLYLDIHTGLTIRGNFTSKAYDIKVYPEFSSTGGLFGIEIINKRNKIVSIQGKGSSGKAKIETDGIDVKGLAEFQNTNIYTSKVVLGGSSYEKTFVTLDNSNLYLYHPDLSKGFKLQMFSQSAIGYPDSSKDRAFVSYKGSNIITQKTTYYGIKYPQRKWKDDGEKDIKWISNATIKSAQKYFFVNRTHCSFWGCHKGHDNLGSYWTLDGYGTAKQVVCKENGDNGCDGAQTYSR